MTHDPDVLRSILKPCLLIAAFFSTTFPVLYLFSPWYKSKLGRLLMFQSASFALAVDVTLLFLLWQPKNILVYFWTSLFTFSFIAVACACLTWGLWRTNHSKWSIHSSEQKK